MATLNLAIGKSKYTINCDEAEHEKVVGLAHKVNEKVNKLSLELRGVDEKTILMLSALMMQEELDNASNTDFDSKLEEKLANEIDILADKISIITKKIQNS